MTKQETSSDHSAAISERNLRVRQLLQGELRPCRDTPSLIFMTVHKCASSYVDSLLTRIAWSEKIVPIDIETFVWNSTQEALKPYVSSEFLDFFTGKRTEPSDSLRDEIVRRLPCQGLYYGAVRANPFYQRMPHFDQFRGLLMVRDPRDVLTSLYFSVAFSHVTPSGAESVRRAFLKHRDKVRQMGVDAYVLASAEQRLQIYADYCREVLGRPNVLLLKYEDMVRDFRPWLEQIVAYWGLPTNTPTIAQLIKEADFTVSREDPNSHKRQVQPGDHKRKLKSETIDRLNEMFAEILDTLGYDRASSVGRDAA
jgi:hypothetical protein